MKKIILLLVLALFGIWACNAEDARKKESDYVKEWCGRHGGRVEVRLDDGTRADCVTNTHAIEFDFAPKYAEGFGQAVHYARVSGLRAGIVLICEKAGDEVKLGWLMNDIDSVGADVTVWNMGCE